MNRSGILATVCATLLCASLAAAEAPKSSVAVSIHTDRPEALYKCHEPATFTISVNDAGQPVTQGEVVVTLTRDLATKVDQKTIPIGKNPVTISGTLAEPGFLYCEAVFTKDGKPAKALASAGFDPLAVKPVCTMPADFDAFWKAGREEIAQVPLDVQLTPLPAASNDQQDAFKISFASLGGSRIYGFLTVPKGKQPPYPAWVHVPSSGWLAPTKAPTWQAALGTLYLDMCIHDFDPTTPPPDLDKRPPYAHAGAPDRDKYYFRRSLLGLDRALDYLISRPDCDGKHLLVTGSSQGGALTLMLAGLNEHVSAALAGVPAMCDHSAGLAGRKPTWPTLFGASKGAKEWSDMAQYFDSVNFARKIKCPTIVYVGFIDTTCPAACVYGAYNSITAPKCIFNGPLSGHRAAFPR